MDSQIGSYAGVVASIGVVMLGSLPVAELLRRDLDRPFAQLGGKIAVKS